MANDFEFDVFLSHSAKDKAVARPLAERLRKDRLKVWFNEWVLKPGDSIPARIEEGLEHSRVLVLCISANAFESDRAQLESHRLRFRDPLNKERRFTPQQLDDASFRRCRPLQVRRCGMERLKFLPRSPGRTRIIALVC